MKSLAKYLLIVFFLVFLILISALSLGMFIKSSIGINIFLNLNSYPKRIGAILVFYIIIFGGSLIFYLKGYSNNEKLQKLNKLFIYSDIFLFILLCLPSLHFLEKISLPWLPLKIFTEQAIFFQIAGISVVISLILGSLLAKKIRKIRIPSWTIYLLIALAALIYIVFDFLKYRLYAYAAQDFGIAIQAIWQYSKFKLAITTLTEPIGGLLWGQHFHPIWVFVAPLFWLWKDPRALLILDSIITCLGALPIFWLAKKFLKNNLSALLLAFAYLFFFGVQFALNFPFRGDTLGATFLAFAIWYLIKKDWGKYAIFALLALMCKENFSLYVVFLGIYALTRKNWLPGVLSILFGFSWFYFCAVYFIPIMTNSHSYVQFTYNALGPNIFAVIINIFLHPLHALTVLFSPDLKLFAMLALFASLTFIPFLAPSALILAIPMIAERFFSSNQSLWQTGFHYSITIAPALFLAAILGINKLGKNQFFLKISNKKILAIALSLSIVLSVLFVDLYLRSPLTNLGKKYLYSKTDEDKELKEVYAMIPADASVAAQSSLVPAIAMRDKIFLFPFSLDKVDYILLDTNTDRWPLFEEKAYTKTISDIIKSNEWGLIYSKKSVMLLEKNRKNQVQLSILVNDLLKTYGF